MSMLSRFATFGGGGDPYWNNVSYLLVGNGANGTTTNIKDSSNNNLTTTIAGNTVISTAQSKFGSGSVYFDGTGDYTQTQFSSTLAFGTGNFTIEGWWYLSSVTGGYKGLFHLSPTDITGQTFNGYAVGIDPTGLLQYYYNGTYQISSTTLTAGSFTHIAVVRASGILTVYINGVKPTTGGSVTDTQNLATGALWLGTYYYLLNTMTGYIYDIRVTKGVARYTANYTPPPFPPTSAMPTY